MFVAGVVGVTMFVYLTSRNRQQLTPAKVIKPGDKSSEVNALQNAISSMTGLQFENMGVYDSETLSAVKYYLEGSNALIDYEKGYVSKDFASDLNIIQEKNKK